MHAATQTLGTLRLAYSPGLGFRTATVDALR
ncbi:MAG: hypothetical protein QOJ35_2563, partial [Solirubrobacteraceae bacterium]|nr:hypothetical protein [Solirubrobacteraceae bacterium]